ncbi:MAG: hypothetical protein QOH26_1027 [Actinomycetota bacterium]|jgi:hypothetical protein|nr:hypothetical protein [Actinomycetota bacterium]
MADGSVTMLSKEELKGLAQVDAFPSVSIYFPTVKAAVESQENSLHLKNLLSEAEERLLASNLRRPEVDRLLKPARELLDDTQFWLHQRHGFALFLSADFFRYYELPFEVQPRLSVQSGFHITPLSTGLTETGHFYILALAMGGIRLLRCDTVTAEEIDLSVHDIPLNLDEALRWDDLPQRATPESPVARPGSGITPMHGQTIKEERDEQIQRFFKSIQPTITKILMAEHAPLVLAGVEYERGLYRRISDYPNVLENGINGNPEGLRPDELREKALPLVSSVLRQPQMDAYERYGVLQARGQASCDLEHCLKAAYEGRVDSLFILKGAQAHGRFDDTMLTIHSRPDDGNAVDLLDLAASRTLLTGGDVYVVDSPDMPCEGDIAAVYRY